MLTSVPYAGDLTSAIRAAHVCLTGRQMAQHVARTEGVRVDPRLAAERGDAINAPASYFGVKVPWLPFMDEPSYCPGSAPHAKLLSLLTRIYADASAETGAKEVRDQARTELLGDLGAALKPSAWGPWVIGAAALAALFFAWRLFGGRA